MGQIASFSLVLEAQGADIRAEVDCSRRDHAGIETGAAKVTEDKAICALCGVGIAEGPIVCYGQRPCKALLSLSQYPMMRLSSW